MPLDHLWFDVRSACRQFARRPGLTVAALLALTCGLGGVITVFTLVDAVIYRPLPVRAPGELVTLRFPSFSYPLFQELQTRGTMLSNVFAWTSRSLHVQWAGDPESTQVLMASGRIHETLGIRPALGRLLVDADAGRTEADAQAVAVLSHAAWTRRFGADPSVIGRTIRIEGAPFTIVGVTPREFFGIAVGAPVDVTIPVTMAPRLREDERDSLTQGGRSWLHIMGRLRPGLTVQEGDAAFQTVWPQIKQATADLVSASFRPRYLGMKSGLDAGAAGFSPVRRQFREPLLLLFGLVALLLIAACATVANLLLASAAGRRHELAVRLALGAGRRRIVQQLFVEGLLLAVIGGLFGLLVASWAADLLVRLLSTSYDVVSIDVTPDLRVVAFMAAAVAAATLAFTLAPIVRAARIDPGPMLEAGTRHVGGLRRARLARVLVAAQVAISLTLVAGSALFVRNLSQILATDMGFDRERLFVVTVDAVSPISARSRGAIGPLPYYAELQRRLQEAPGVRAASLSMLPPVSNEFGSWWERVWADGTEMPAVRTSERTYLNMVSPGYFATLKTPLLAGRDFTDGDRLGTPRVAIINATLARSAFGGESAVGRTVLMGDKAERVEVIGVVGDATYESLQEDRRRVAFVPYAQMAKMLGEQNLVAEVRLAEQGGGSAAEAIRAAVRSVDASAPLAIQSVAMRIDESLVGERLITVIAVFLGAVSLLLACGALGGLMAHLVAARTREIGLRLALGADRRAVLNLVMSQALSVAILGGLAGLGMTLAAGRLVTRFLHDVSPADPLSLGAAATVLLATSALAGYLPARRAARVDPMIALRD